MPDGEVKVVITDEGSAQNTASEIGKTSGAINDLGGETKKAGEAAEGMNIHSREMRLLFTEINKIAPGLGHELHAAFAGPLGPIILLSIAIAEVKEKLKEYNKELDDAGDRAAQPLTDGVKNLQDAWDDAKKSLGEYLALYDEAGKDKDPISTQVKREKELSDARIDGIKKQIEALEKLEEHQIRTDNTLNRQEKEEALAAARANSQESIDALEGGKSVADLQREQATRSANQQALAMAVDAAKDSTAVPNAKAQDQDDELANLKAALDPNSKPGSGKGLMTQGDQDAAKKLLDTFAKVNSGQGDYSDKWTFETSGKQTVEVQADYDRITAALTEQRRRQAEIESGETEVSREKAVADDALKTAEADALKNKTRLGQLPGEIDQAKAVQAAKADIPGLGAAVADVFSADQAYARGQKLTGDQSATIIALKQMLDTAGDNTEAILQLILDGAKKHETLAQVVADVQKQIGPKF